MFRLFKLTFYLFLVAAALFLYWFLPKYSFISKNPGYCVRLSQHLFYCGNDSRLDRMFNSK